MVDSGGRPADRRPIRAVLFDAVGTLFRSRGTIGEIYSETARAHGVEASPGELDRRFGAITGSGGMPVDKDGWRSLVAAVFGDTGRFLDYDAFFEDVFAVFRSANGWRLYPETATVLRRLSGDGFRLGVVTNFDNRVLEVLDQLGIGRFFDCVQTPESSGFRKPDPRIFLAAAGSVGTRPEQTLHVGDSPADDLEGARRAGMHGLLVDRRENPPAASFIIHDLEGLFPYVEKGRTGG